MQDIQSRSENARILATDCGLELRQASASVDTLNEAGTLAAKALQEAVQRLVKEEGKEMGEAIKNFVEEVDLMVRDGGAAAGRVGKEMCARLSKEVVNVSR